MSILKCLARRFRCEDEIKKETLENISKVGDECVPKLIEYIGVLEEELSQYKIDPPFTKKEKVDQTVIGQLLIEQLRNVDIELGNKDMWTSMRADTYYWLIDKEERIRFLAQDQTDKEKYVSEIYDCDDFSFRLMGMVSQPGWSDIPLFIGWSRTHGYNIFIDTDRIVWFIEPQTDKLIKAVNFRKLYTFRPVRLVIG